MAPGTVRDCFWSYWASGKASSILQEGTSSPLPGLLYSTCLRCFSPMNKTHLLLLSKRTCIAFVTKAAEIGLMNSFCLAVGLQNTQGQGLCRPISKYQAAFPRNALPLRQLLFRTDVLPWPCLILPSREMWNSISVSLIYVESGTVCQMVWCSGASHRCDVHFCV